MPVCVLSLCPLPGQQPQYQNHVHGRSGELLYNVKYCPLVLSRFDAFLSDKPVNGILYKKASLWVDSNALIPVKFMLYNFKDELYERYVLKNIELNVDIPQSLFAAVK